jgi:hypothetical protein
MFSLHNLHTVINLKNNLYTGCPKIAEQLSGAMSTHVRNLVNRHNCHYCSQHNAHWLRETNQTNQKFFSLALIKGKSLS